MLASFALMPAQASTGDWVINGDTVYVDDANAYLSATPHTLRGSGWVELELNSKKYEGQIDVVWGFDTGAGVLPRKAQVWANNVPHDMERWIVVERSGQATFDNVTGYEVLTPGSEPPDIGNTNNSKLIRLTIDDFEGHYELVVAYNTYTQHSPSSATFYYNYDSTEKEYYTEYYPDYRDFADSNFGTLNYDYLNVDKWYYMNPGPSIVKDTTYKMRVWVDVPFTGLSKFRTKYVWGVKPAGETIPEARASGHLYLLDPWLEGGWNKRVKISINSTDVDEVLTDFPIMVSINATSGINSSDLTFVFDELTSDANRKKIAVTTDDGTQCYVEIVGWDDAGEQAWLWFKAPSVDNVTDTDFYLYYDADLAENTAYVGDTSNASAESVWDSSYEVVWHMDDGVDTATLYDSTDNDVDGAKFSANNPIEGTGEIGKGQTYDEGNDAITLSGVAIGSTHTMEWFMNSDQKNANGSFLIDTQTGRQYCYYQTSTNNITASAVVLYPTPSEDIYHHIVMILNGGTSKAGLYIDGVLVASNIAYTPTLIGGTTRLGARYTLGGYEILGIIDEFRISSVIRTPGWVTASYENLKDDLVYYGAEEELAAPTVTSDSSSNVEATTATATGNVTTTGGENVTTRWIQYGIATGNYTDNATESGSWGTGSFSLGLTGLSTGTTYYWLAGATGPGGSGNGTELSFLTKPAPPTNVSATDGSSTANVTITWTKSTGSANYTVYEGSNILDTVGDVATYTDITAAAGIITPGTASAADGTSATIVTLSASGESVASGTARTYKVVAINASGNSTDSDTDTGYRGVGAITYQWQRSDADSDASYSNIGGGTTDPYNDVAGVVSPDGRYYKALISSNGTASQNTTADRGYMSVVYPDTPTDFTLTDLGGVMVNASWTSANATYINTMRVSRAEYPITITSGELAYNGTAETVNLTGYSVDRNIYYFSLWSTDNGTDSLTYATASIGETTDTSGFITEAQMAALADILSLGIYLMPLVLLTILAFWQKNIILYIISATITILIGATWMDTIPGVGVMLWGLATYELYLMITMVFQASGEARGWSQLRGWFKGKGE